MGKRKNDLPPLPVRVVVDKHGGALTPEHAWKYRKIKPEIVFVRNDGWALGAPYKFADVAYSLWKDEWVLFYNMICRDITMKASLYPKMRESAKQKKGAN